MFERDKGDQRVSEASHGIERWLTGNLVLGFQRISGGFREVSEVFDGLHGVSEAFQGVSGKFRCNSRIPGVQGIAGG